MLRFSRLRGIFVVSLIMLIVDNAPSTNFHFVFVLPPNIGLNTFFERNSDSIRFEVTAPRRIMQMIPVETENSRLKKMTDARVVV